MAARQARRAAGTGTTNDKRRRRAGSSIAPPSILERVSGSLTAEVALTTVAALAGGPLAALLPILGNSLAATRQRERVTAALTAIDGILSQHAESLLQISDAQYTLVNESAIALLRTTDDRKIEILKSAVRNSLNQDAIADQDAVSLSRVIRDISADEALFLFRNQHYRRVLVRENAGHEFASDVLTIDHDSTEAVVVSGLTSLGILGSAGPTMNDIGLLAFSSLAPKVIALLRP